MIQCERKTKIEGEIGQDNINEIKIFKRLKSKVFFVNILGENAPIIEIQLYK